MKTTHFTALRKSTGRLSAESIGLPKVTAAILISLLVLSLCFSQQKDTAISKQAGQLRPKPAVIKMVDFHLRDGQLIFGKLISDDKNKLTVERLDESRIVVSTYSKRDIDARTMQTKNILEYKYYTDLAEYFSGRTWDFRDDPDDFIQAIRCYEKARELVLETQSPDSKKVTQIDKKIEQLKEERQAWTEQAESRARLKSLEFEAGMEKRIEELEAMINQARRRTEKNKADIRDNSVKLNRNISAMKKDITRQFDVMVNRIETNAALLNRIDDYLRWLNWHPWPLVPQLPRKGP